VRALLLKRSHIPHIDQLKELWENAIGINWNLEHHQTVASEGLCKELALEPATKACKKNAMARILILPGNKNDIIEKALLTVLIEPSPEALAESAQGGHVCRGRR
jgi:hypothetical protein